MSQTRPNFNLEDNALDPESMKSMVILESGEQKFPNARGISPPPRTSQMEKRKRPFNIQVANQYERQINQAASEFDTTEQRITGSNEEQFTD